MHCIIIPARRYVFFFALNIHISTVHIENFALTSIRRGFHSRCDKLQRSCIVSTFIRLSLLAFWTSSSIQHCEPEQQVTVIVSASSLGWGYLLSWTR
jgi:hypothetical protein